MDQAERLRTIVKQKNNSSLSHARIITVTSGKGGVGKSTVTINLAIQFVRQGKRVVIFDADFGLANIEVMFGVVPKYTLADLLFKNMNIKDIILDGPEGVKFISSGSGVTKLINLDSEQIKHIVYKLSELDELADIILIDTGAGVSSSVTEFITSSPETIFVTTPEPTSITDSYALLKTLSINPEFKKESTSIKLITNRISSERESDNVSEKLSSVVERFLGINIEKIGSVPQDEHISKAIMRYKPVSLIYPDSDSSKAFKKICATLDNNENTEIERRSIASVFGNLFKKRK